MFDLQPIQLWALACVILFFKMFAIAMIQGQQRTKYKVFTKPEDAAYWGKTDAAEAERPLVDQGQRALRNDLENIPMFLFISYAYVQLKCWPQGLLIYLSLFIVARIAHTIFFLNPKQPFRTIAYGVGILVTLAMCGHIINTCLIA